MGTVAYHNIAAYSLTSNGTCDVDALYPAPTIKLRIPKSVGTDIFKYNTCTYASWHTEIIKMNGGCVYLLFSVSPYAIYEFCMHLEVDSACISVIGLLLIGLSL